MTFIFAKIQPSIEKVALMGTIIARHHVEKNIWLAIKISTQKYFMLLKIKYVFRICAKNI